MPHATEPDMVELHPNVAIIGAGIGGLALAIGLLRHNVSFTLYESGPAYSEMGAGVGLGPNALTAMESLHQELRPMYDGISSGNLTPNKDHVMFDAHYAEAGLGDARGWVPASYGAACYQRTSAHRKHLLDIMTSLIPNDRVQFNKRLRHMEQQGEKVVITFEDGKVVEADAVVGADGVRGPTRRLVLGAEYPNQVEAIYSGKYAYRSVIPMGQAKEILGTEQAGDARSFLGPGINLITFPISMGEQVNLVAFKWDSSPWDIERGTQKVTHQKMLADFENVDHRLLQLLELADPVQWAIFHHPNTATYYNQRICLLGDTAHATSPHQAAGAGQCIEDALILSQLLGLVKDTSQIQTAFHVYDSIRRPRAQEVVRTSQEMGEMYSFSHPDFEDNMAKIVEDFNKRFLWIWQHDLEGDVKMAEAMFFKMINDSDRPA